MGEPAHRRHRPNSELTLAIPVLASTASSDSGRAIAFKASARTIAVKSAAVSSATAPPHAFQNDPDRLLGRIMLARRPSDVLDNLLVGVVAPPGGGDQSKSEDQPHAKQIAHAPQLAMRSEDKERQPVPVARDAERPLQDAWRTLSGRSEGE